MSTTTTPTKWARLVAGLTDKGLSYAAIATAAESKPSTIASLLKGTTQEPGHALGERLLALARQHKVKA